MIELEIQGLSADREGLLLEVGRFVVANRFTLQRQRLVQDPHGTLMTLVVRGPARKRRALEADLDAYERLISFQVYPFVEGEPRAHFAASRKLDPALVAPPPAPAREVTATPAAQPEAPHAGGRQSWLPGDLPTAVAGAAVEATAADESVMPGMVEPEPEFLLPSAPPSVPVVPVAVEQFVDVVPLGPDEAAVDAALRGLEQDYPGIIPKLLALRNAVAEAACESSLALAGRRSGTWLFNRDFSADVGLDALAAMERVGVPALAALVEVEQQGTQLHIDHSPLCEADGHSGCSFFSGFLEALLGPVVAPGDLTITSLCCRSFGADECVLAISG